MIAPLLTIDMPKVLIILRGIPGSGKSTLASILSHDARYKAVAADDFLYSSVNVIVTQEALKEAHQRCQTQVDEWMSISEPRIVVHNTSTTEWEVGNYMELAKKHDYKVISLIVENRHGSVSDHDVPSEKIDDMRENLKNSIKL